MTADDESLAASTDVAGPDGAITQEVTATSTDPSQALTVVVESGDWTCESSITADGAPVVECS
ncbi:hypothetical protein NKG05_27270 [Oerskovia sp. M15]